MPLWLTDAQFSGSSILVSRRSRTLSHRTLTPCPLLRIFTLTPCPLLRICLGNRSGSRRGLVPDP